MLMGIYEGFHMKRTNSITVGDHENPYMCMRMLYMYCASARKARIKAEKERAAKEKRELDRHLRCDRPFETSHNIVRFMTCCLLE